MTSTPAPIRLLRLLVFLAALALGGVLYADEVPRLQIDSVLVEGAPASMHSVIVAESGIEAGQAYTESELRHAISRVNRLPFVIRADLRLTKGEERGRYILVISVVDTKPLFISLRSIRTTADTRELVAMLRHPETEELIPIVRERVGSRMTQDATLGGRWFLGSKGMLHAAAAQGDDLGASLGYTQFDLFGTRASISALVTYDEPSLRLPEARLIPVGPTKLSLVDKLGWQVAAAMPIAGNHALHASWERKTFPYVINRSDPLYPDGRLAILRLHGDEQTLAWIYDTTNDPIFPTSGTRIRAAVGAHREIHFRPGPTGFTYDLEYERVQDVAASAATHWAFTPRQSLFASAESQVRSNRRLQQTAMRLGYAARLWERDDGDAFDELRLEAHVEEVVVRIGVRDRYRIASAGLAFRNSWGLVRIAFSADWGRWP